MLKQAVLVGVLSVATSCAALAAETPSTPEDCLKQMQTLISEAEAVDLLDDQIDLAELEFGKMERSCLDKHFGEAMAAAEEVRKILATNK